MNRSILKQVGKELMQMLSNNGWHIPPSPNRDVTGIDRFYKISKDAPLFIKLVSDP